MGSISPMDILQIGTIVSVGNKIGYVYKAKYVKDQFGQPICLHTIHYIAKNIGRGVDGYRYVAIDKVEDCGYSHINTLDKISSNLIKAISKMYRIEKI